MNIGELFKFIEQITDDEVSDHVIKAMVGVTDTYVEPFCKIIAKSCLCMLTALRCQGFTEEQAMQIVVAMLGRGKK